MFDRVLNTRLQAVLKCFVKQYLYAEAHLGPCQASIMELRNVCGVLNVPLK